MAFQNSSQRTSAYKAINCLGAVVSLTDLEEERDVVIEYAFDPSTRRVLTGAERGQDVDILELLTRRALRYSCKHIAAKEVRIRPWWRLWRPVTVLRLTLEKCS